MYKRVVGEYVKDELKKGKTIEQIRKRLIKLGYKEKDVDEVLRGFEYREADLKQKERKVSIAKTRVHVLLSLMLIIVVVNAAFFFYYFSNPKYVLVRETPTGLVTTKITEEELMNLEKSLNISESSEGLSRIT